MLKIALSAGLTLPRQVGTTQTFFFYRRRNTEFGDPLGGGIVPFLILRLDKNIAFA